MDRRSTTIFSQVIAVVSLAAWLSSPACAGGIDISVLDADGHPVPNVAAYVTQEGSDSAGSPKSAVMDQLDTRFVPHILVVQKGTAVEFPNSDVVAHHVYSFSKPNSFVLPLYKGDAHDPITLEHDGIVTLGCNIHDQMLGYIVVVDTNMFGVTDESGSLTVDLNGSGADITISIWSPRIRDKDLTKVIAASSTSAVFSLRKKLRPAHGSSTDAMQWSKY
jgi:plastocyanin